MNSFDNQLDNTELMNINGGGPWRDLYDDAKYIYNDVKNHWDDMCDFASGFWDGLCGN